MRINRKRAAYLKELIRKNGLIDRQQEIIGYWSGGQAGYVKDLTEEQGENFIKSLEEMTRIHDESLQKMIADIADMLDRLGLYELPEGEDDADHSWLDFYLQKYKFTKKDLSDCKYNEVLEVHKAMERRIREHEELCHYQETLLLLEETGVSLSGRSVA